MTKKYDGSTLRMKWQTAPGECSRNEGGWYAETVAKLFKNPGCIGFHLCGAYQRNRARRYGLWDEQERRDEQNVPLMKVANEQIARWMNEPF